MFRVTLDLKSLVVGIALLVGLVGGAVLGATAGTATRQENNKLVVDGSSGNDGIAFDVNGLRLHLGTGSNDYLESNGTTQISTPTGFAALGLESTSGQIGLDGPTGVVASSGTVTFNVGGGTLTADAYIASATPFTLSSITSNALTTTGTVYGGTVLPAHAFTVTDVGIYVSVSSTGAGTTTFRITNGGSDCDCARACADTTVGPEIVTCAGACVFAASDALTYSVSTSTCATTDPIILNLDIRGNWQL